MSRKPKSAASYPEEYFKIVEDCFLRGQKFSLTMPSPSQARSLQGKFYTFRQAVERDLAVAMAQPGSLQAGMKDKLMETLQFARETVCWFDHSIKEGPVTVWFMGRSQTPEALLLAEARKRSLAEAGEHQPTDLDAEAEASAERVRALLEQDPPKKNPYY
jgi:hypothetical protein